MSQYITLLRHNRSYRYLWLGSVVTQLGDWFNLLASAELITELTSSGVAISSLFLARFLPLFLFSPIAGVLADRYNRRYIMILTDWLRALIVLGFLLVRSPTAVWLLYLLTILQFSLSALFTPARTALLANVVQRRDLVTANALDSLTWSTMLALGAFLGGAVAAYFGTAAAFVMDAATFAFSGWIVSKIVDASGATAVSSKSFSKPARAIFEGYRYLSSVPFILGIALVKAAGSLVWGAINVVEITFANNVFALPATGLAQLLRIEAGGTATLGIIYVVSGLGTGLGPLLLRRWLGDAYHRLLLGISAGFGLLAGGILWLSAAPTLGFFLLATLTRTVGSGVVWVFSAALLQMLVPNDVRGRVFAFEFAMLTLTQSISTYAAGFLQDNLSMSVQQATAVMGYAGVFVAAIWLLFLLLNLPHVRRWRSENSH